MRKFEELTGKLKSQEFNAGEMQITYNKDPLYKPSKVGSDIS